MRNGNSICRINFIWHISSYPTYEEWKRCIYNSLNRVRKLVLILPMRNGNPFCNILYISFDTVLILPMRNGNVLALPSMKLCCCVLILPMRNGNHETEEELFAKVIVLILPMRNGNYKYNINNIWR